LEPAYILSFMASFLQAVFTPALVLYAYSLSLDELQISVISGVASFVYVAGSLTSSAAHNRLSGSKIIALAFGVMSAGFAALLFSKTFTGILASSSLVLLGFGLFWPAVEAHLSRSGSSVSKFSFSWSSGSLVGALLTSTLLKLDLKLLFVAYTALSISQSALGLRIKGSSSSVYRHAGDAGTRDLLLLWAPWAYCIAYSASSSGVFTFYPLFVESRSLSRDYISLVNFTMLLTRTATFFFYDKAPRSLRNPLLAMLGFLAGLGLTSTANPILVALISGLIGYAQGMIYATALDLVFSRGSGIEKATSLFEAFIGLGYAAAPPLSGAANAAFGFEPISFASVLALATSLSASLSMKSFNTTRHSKTRDRNY